MKNPLSIIYYPLCMIGIGLTFAVFSCQDEIASLPSQEENEEALFSEEIKKWDSLGEFTVKGTAYVYRYVNHRRKADGANTLVLPEGDEATNAVLKQQDDEVLILSGIDAFLRSEGFTEEDVKTARDVSGKMLADEANDQKIEVSPMQMALVRELDSALYEDDFDVMIARIEGLERKAYATLPAEERGAIFMMTSLSRHQMTFWFHELGMPLAQARTMCVSDWGHVGYAAGVGAVGGILVYGISAALGGPVSFTIAVVTGAVLGAYGSITSQCWDTYKKGKKSAKNPGGRFKRAMEKEFTEVIWTKPGGILFPEPAELAPKDSIIKWNKKRVNWDSILNIL